MNKKVIQYFGLAVLTFAATIFLFIFNSTELNRTVFFYFQMIFSLFLELVFWLNMILSSRLKSDESNSTAGIVSSGMLILYIGITSLIMILYSIFAKTITYDSYYYSSIVVITVIFIVIASLGRIFAAKDSDNSSESFKYRNDLKSLASSLDDFKMNLSLSGISDKAKLENEITSIISALNRKVPDKSLLNDYYHKLEAEVELIQNLSFDASDIMIKADESFKKIRNYLSKF
jgi:uncharacterized membrane protein YqjE